MDGLTKKGFMPHHDGRFRYPGSRDFMMDQPQCLAVKCVCNSGGYCFAPSRAVIGEDGRCKNFGPKPKKNPNIKGE